MSDDKADIIVIDGMNTLWRAAHAMKALGFEDRNGWTETGAVYGFLDQALAVTKRHRGAQVYVAWEGSRAGRRDIMPEYKEHRDEPDERMAEALESISTQRGILKSILKMTSWIQLHSPGWEADDTMATIAERGAAKGLNVLLLSNDTDMFQCLEEATSTRGFVRQWKSGKNTNDPLWTPARLLEEKGVSPEVWHAVKALGGDTSDGYKGAKGIGEGWACKLLAAHGSLDEILAAAKRDELTPAKARGVIDGWDYVLQCLEVATVQRHTRTVLDIGKPNEKKLADTFAGLRFHSLHSPAILKRLTK